MLEQRQKETKSVRERGLLTVHNDFNDPQINLAAGHESTLTCVWALICLLYATDLKMIVAEYLKPNWKEAEDKCIVRCVMHSMTNKGSALWAWHYCDSRLSPASSCCRFISTIITSLYTITLFTVTWFYWLENEQLSNKFKLGIETSWKCLINSYSCATIKLD